MDPVKRPIGEQIRKRIGQRVGGRLGREPGEEFGEGPGDRQADVRRAGIGYQGAFESFFAILIGAGLGYWADATFDSSPWGLLVGLLLGVSAMVLRLVRLARQLQAMAEPGSRGPEEG